MSSGCLTHHRYFSMQASVPLGVDDISRIEIENSICREGGPLPECFTYPMEHVLCLLEEVTYFKERFQIIWTIKEEFS